MFKNDCEDLKNTLESLSDHIDKINLFSEYFIQCFSKGNKIILCGNGGSASDSIHIAAEFVGRFELERKSLPALSLASDISSVTAIANDFGYEYTFSRQLEGHAKKGDILVSLSTSGNSKNVIEAVKIAKNLGVISLSFSGRGGGELAKISEDCITIESDSTARIQEAHKFILHYISGCVDRFYHLN